MNLVYGEIIEVSSEEGMPIGRIKVHGAIKKIPLGLLTDARQGDRVLICDGMAISKVAHPPNTEVKHVSGDSRKDH
ncbi:MAG: HypC/HybG/HupF family hydrogenase formation chaperone [Verrucomicrobiota bacterium]|nr:HypC/HybG/HupF family hydrogenase formation chaperone [Verrucomicrobiota bacterium]